MNQLSIADAPRQRPVERLNASLLNSGPCVSCEQARAAVVVTFHPGGSFLVCSNCAEVAS